MHLEKNQPQEAQNAVCEQFEWDAANLYSYSIWNFFFLNFKIFGLLLTLILTYDSPS